MRPATKMSPAVPSQPTTLFSEARSSTERARTMAQSSAVTSQACASRRRRSYHLRKPSRAISLPKLGDDGGMIRRALEAPRRLVDGTADAALCKRRREQDVVDAQAPVALE